MLYSIYKNVDGQKQTKAEAFLSWLLSGWSLDSCRWWLHYRNVAVRLPNEIRHVDESWKKAFIENMMAASSSGGSYSCC